MMNMTMTAMTTTNQGSVLVLFIYHNFFHLLHTNAAFHLVVVDVVVEVCNPGEVVQVASLSPPPCSSLPYL